MISDEDTAEQIQALSYHPFSARDIVDVATLVVTQKIPGFLEDCFLPRNSSGMTQCTHTQKYML